MAANGTLTWLGHAAFRLDTPGGKRIYIDPFLNGNPRCPEAEQTPGSFEIERFEVVIIGTVLSVTVTTWVAVAELPVGSVAV